MTHKFLSLEIMCGSQVVKGEKCVALIVVLWDHSVLVYGDHSLVFKGMGVCSW